MNLNDSIVKIFFVDCPTVKHELTTARVLVMEYIDGHRIDEISKLKAQGYNVEELGIHLGKKLCKTNH